MEWWRNGWYLSTYVVLLYRRISCNDCFVLKAHFISFSCYDTFLFFSFYSSLRHTYSFWNYEFDEAIALYLSAIPIARERLSNLDADITVGDINVKISIILQGRGELQSTIDHLLKAKDIFTNAYNDIKSEHNNDRIVIMAEKIMEVTNGIANTFVEMGEKKEAVKYHEVRTTYCTPIPF